MNINETTRIVQVHGREALVLPYARWTPDTPSVQEDISATTMYIEILAAGIRKELEPNPSDPKGLLIVLTRAEVARIPITPTPYIILDETVVNRPALEFESKIYRTGYTEEPHV